MTEIINGELVYNELTAQANGGTELMARRMVRDLDPELLKGVQIIHSRVRELQPAMKRILVCHDLAGDDEVRHLADPEYRKQFDKIVFVSNWQAQHYHLVHGIRYSEFRVIPNAIEPFPLVTKKYGGPVRLIYHTTPHRGLDIAVAVVDELSKHVDVHFDVFSSFRIYGWESRDEPYIQLFDRIRSHPHMTYHGSQPNSLVRRYLEDAHVFLYPSVWPETSCLAAIEALCAGCVVVHPNFGALPETCEHSTVMYQYDENRQTHAMTALNHCFHAVKSIIETPDVAKTVAQQLQNRYNTIYNWSNVQRMWTSLLREIHGTSETGTTEQGSS